MKSTKPQVTFTLSILVTAFAAFASLAGLFVPHLYNDKQFVQTAWYGNDWVTLVVVVPSLIVTIAL